MFTMHKPQNENAVDKFSPLSFILAFHKASNPFDIHNFSPIKKLFCLNCFDSLATMSYLPLSLIPLGVGLFLSPPVILCRPRYDI